MANPLRRNEDITVLIPAAGRVPEGLLALSNISCTALIPVAGRPVIYWTLTYLRSLGLRRFCIAVPSRGLFVEDFVECTVGRDCEVTFMVPPSGPSGGVGETVAALFDFVETPAALVVLGDTFFQFADPTVLDAQEPLILTGPVEESYRWCIAESDEQGYIERLHDKEKGLQGPLQALIGVYFFPNAALARRVAREVVGARRAPAPTGPLAGAGRSGIEDEPSGPQRVELVSVLTLLNSRTPIRVRRAGEWLDCGNPDRQAASHVALLQKREFNELSIDRTLSTITKRSRMKAKFIDEINYLRLLPRDLAVLFPRVVDFSIEWEDPWLTMEYYGYATLAEVFVYENLDPGVWQRIFGHLFTVITTAFMRYQRPLPAEVLLDMYLHKTARRVAELTGPPELLALKDATGVVHVNGRPCPSLNMAWPRIEEDVRRLSANTTGCVIHGDLCFSNILYDARSQICKFVDPRGSFGQAGITGDPRYDVAKLYHSVMGLYDFITNDLFHVGIDGMNVTLDVRARVQHRQILERFEQVFFAMFDRRELRLLTALIFVGIPALHYDKPDRQLAMFATGLQILGELYPVSA